MPTQRKIVPDELLLLASVKQLDPDTPLLAAKAGMLLGRSKTRMDSDRREGRPPASYKDRRKVLYRLADVLAERARMQKKTKREVDLEREEEARGWPALQTDEALR